MFFNCFTTRKWSHIEKSEVDKWQEQQSNNSVVHYGVACSIPLPCLHSLFLSNNIFLCPCSFLFCWIKGKCFSKVMPVIKGWKLHFRLFWIFSSLCVKTKLCNLNIIINDIWIGLFETAAISKRGGCNEQHVQMAQGRNPSAYRLLLCHHIALECCHLKAKAFARIPHMNTFRGCEENCFLEARISLCYSDSVFVIGLRLLLRVLCN